MPEAHVTVKLALSPLPGGRYRSRIEESPAGASRGSGTDFDLPAPREGGYPKFIKDVDAGTLPEAELREFGKTLFQNVFAGTVGQAFEGARAWGKSRKAFLRLAVSALSPELVQVPWEYLHDGNNYLLAQPQTHIVRVLDELPQEMAPFRPFRRLLLAVANPRGQQRFDSDAHIATMQDLLGAMGAQAIVVSPASKATLSQAIEDEDFDAFYFLGHGQIDSSDGSQILLENMHGDPDPLSAATLAKWLGGHRKQIYFAFFNSCYTGATDLSGTFAGVAQRILADGRIPAVVAQQAPVLAQQSMKVAEAFLRSVGRGDSPETAITFARSAAENVTWGIPVLYTHLRGPEEFERNRIAFLVGAEIGKSRYGIVLSSFGMGVQLDGLGKITAPRRGTYCLPASPHEIQVTVEPPETFVFPGDTHARDDVEAAWDIIGLLTRVARPSEIGFYKSTNQQDVTHWFLFGSRSNSIVASLLENYSPRFGFRYTNTEWFLDELDDKGHIIEPTNKIPAPHSLGAKDYANQDDLGIIEKITDESGRVFLIIAGLGSRATRGCGRYLAAHWEDLVTQFGAQDFGIMLRFPGGLSFDHAEQIELRAARSAGA